MSMSRTAPLSTAFSSFPFSKAHATLSVMEPPVPDTIEEYPWMINIAQGDQQALRLLVSKWQKPIYHFFYRFLQQRETAEDLTQNVFIRLYKAAPNYQPSARFSTYIFHIARKVLYNEFRHQQRKPSTGLEDLSPHHQEQALMDEGTQQYEEWEEWMESALQQLPDRQKEVMLLHVQQGLPYEEIAAIMETPVSTVKSLLFRARQNLRNLLNQNF